MKLTGNKAALAAGLIALTALSGCDKPAPEQPVPENAVDEVVAENVAVPEETPAPAPPPVEAVNTAAEEEVRETPPDPDAQTIDDADATGMTSRVRRDEASANEATP